jgi:hypothetical protein
LSDALNIGLVEVPCAVLNVEELTIVEPFGNRAIALLPEPAKRMEAIERPLIARNDGDLGHRESGNECMPVPDRRKWDCIEDTFFAPYGPDEARKVADRSKDRLRLVPPASYDLIRSSELDERNGGAEFWHTEVHADAAGDVLSVVDEAAHFGRKDVVICDNHSALAALERLVNVERKDADVANRSGVPVLLHCERGLRIVLDEPNVALVADSSQFMQPGRVAEEVRNEDSADVCADLDERHLQCERLVIDVAEDRLRPSEHWRRCGRGHGQRRANELAAGADPDGKSCGKESARRAIASDGVLDLECPGPFFFKELNGITAARLAGEVAGKRRLEDFENRMRLSLSNCIERFHNFLSLR